MLPSERVSASVPEAGVVSFLSGSAEQAKVMYAPAKPGASVGPDVTPELLEEDVNVAGIRKPCTFSADVADITTSVARALSSIVALKVAVIGGPDCVVGVSKYQTES